METPRLIDPGFWQSSDAVAPGARLPADLAGPVPGLVYFQTSGSTGTPRWVGLDREALLLSAAVVNRHLGVDADACWGLALPLHHVGGFGVVARAYEGGARLAVFDGRWDAAGFAAWIEGRGVTHGSLVPTQVHDLVTAGIPAPSGLRAVVVGGGQLDPRTGAAARALGWPVLASYGMTEAGSQVATQGLEVLRESYQSSPLPVLPHWKVGLDPGSGRIVLAGPALFAGMLEAGGDGWRFRARDEEGFLTSDLGRLGPGGLVILGRADAVVKVLGELVDPESITREIGSPHLCVVAVPDPRRGHRLVAACEPPLDFAEAESLVAEFNRDCEGFRRVGEVVPVPSLPRSELSKIRRAELTRLIRSRSI